MKISLSVILILFFFNYSFSDDVNNDELIFLAVENKYRKQIINLEINIDTQLKP